MSQIATNLFLEKIIERDQIRLRLHVFDVNAWLLDHGNCQIADGVVISKYWRKLELAYWPDTDERFDDAMKTFARSLAVRHMGQTNFLTGASDMGLL